MDGGHTLRHSSCNGNSGRPGQLCKFSKVPFLDGPGFKRYGNKNGTLGIDVGTYRIVDNAAELLFQCFRLSRKVNIHPVPGQHIADGIFRGILIRCRGHEVRALKHPRLPPFIHGQNAYRIKPQKEQIHQIFVRKPVGRQVRVKEAQAAQTACACTGMGKFGDKYGRGIPYDDHAYSALPIQRKAYLPSNQAGKSRQFTRLLRAVSALRRIAALPQPVEGFYFAGFQAGGIPFDTSGYCTPPAIQVAIISS